MVNVSRRKAIASALALSIALSSCGGGGDHDTSADSLPRLGLSAALSYVPLDAEFVAYTDWARLGHPSSPDREQTAIFVVSWLDDADRISESLGVRATDAEWQLETEPPGPTILQYAAEQPLTNIADGLEKLGWHRSSSGSVVTLEAPSLTDMSPSVPTNLQFYSFRLDFDTGVVVRYQADNGPPTVDSEFARLDPVPALLSAAGAVTGFALRLGSEACAATGIRTRQPPPPRSFIAPLARITAKFSQVRGTLVAATSQSASEWLALDSPEIARHELRRRLDGSSAVRAFLKLSDAELTFEAVRTAGSLAEYAVTARPPGDIVRAASPTTLGVDICPTT